MKSTQFAEMLRLLAESQVELIVVGVVASVLQGAPLTTGDIDVVHRRTPENVARLLRALELIGATHRRAATDLEPIELLLLGPERHSFESPLGELDCYGTIDGGRVYDALIPFTVPILVAQNVSLPVLSLRELIAAKARCGRPKDLAALPVLQATLDAQRRQV